MSSRGCRTRRGPWALALGMAFLAGCGQFSKHRQPAPPTGLLGGGGERSTRLSTRQAADVEVALGRSMEDQGDLEQAEAAYREAVKKDPKRVDALVRLAILDDQRGKFKESAESFRKALAIRPNDPDILCDQGYSYSNQRRWAEAEDCLRRALKAKRDLARAHNNLGLVLAHEGRDDEAFSEFRKAGCDVSDAHANLALALGMEGRWLESRAHYGAALTAKPTSTVAKDGTKIMTAMLKKPDKSRAIAGIDASVARVGATATVPVSDLRPAQ